MNDAKSKIVELDLNDILPNRFQPRIKFNEESIIELSESIKEHGVIQPIIVRPIGDKYEIIAGERRYKACVLSGATTIPARIFDLNDKDSAEVALIENVQREGLTPIEEAISYKKILDMGYITQEQLARKIGKSQSAIANKKRLLNLCDEVQEALIDEKISERHARSLLKLTNSIDQQKMLKRIISERLTVRKLDIEIEKFLKGEINLDDSNNVIDDQIESDNNSDKKSNDIDNTILDISSLFEEDVVSANMIYNDLIVSEDKKDKVDENKDKKEDGEPDTMFIENNNNSNFNFSNSATNMGAPNDDRKMSMSDILMSESDRFNTSYSSNNQGSMFNNLMTQNNAPTQDSYIDAETFKNYLDPAYIDGQKQVIPQNKDVIDSSVFAKFLDPEYDLSNSNNPVKDQFVKNEPQVSTMSFADYLNGDINAKEIPVAPKVEEPKNSEYMNMNDLLAPTVLNSVPEIKVDELPIVVPSDIPKEEPVIEEVKPVPKEEPPVMVMATDLNSLSVPTPELSTSELLTSSPLEFDTSIMKNGSSPSIVNNEVSSIPTVDLKPTPSVEPTVQNRETKSEEGEVKMQENVQSLIAKDYDVGTVTSDVKPDLLAPIGSPINSSIGTFNPNKTIEQVNRERLESERILYEQATAPLTPDFSAKEEKEPVVPVQPVEQESTDKPIFLTSTQTSVSNLSTAPIIDDPEKSGLLKTEEPVPVVPEPVVEEEPTIEIEPTIINPSIDTLENRPIIVTDYNKQYDPVLPMSDMPVRPQIELKEVINMIRDLNNRIESLGFSIDTEEYDLEDYYQVVFKIDKK